MRKGEKRRSPTLEELAAQVKDAAARMARGEPFVDLGPMSHEERMKHLFGE